MNCKVSKNAAKEILKELEKAENQGLMVRVHITHSHGDHAHYGMTLDKPTDQDEIVKTDKQIDVLLAKNEPLLDGVRIDYFYFPQEGFEITNPARGNHGDH